jgi:hypothetical protein
MNALCARANIVAGRCVLRERPQIGRVITVLGNLNMLIHGSRKH